jgi:hypothetical protein
MFTRYANDSTSSGVDQFRQDQFGFGPVQSKKFLDRDQTGSQFCWARSRLDWTSVDQYSAVSKIRVYASLYQSLNGRNIS